MIYGCAWYPEHWPESRWAQDLKLMREAHMNMVRIAEFAWSSIEPEEGRYELDWIGRAIEAAAAQGFAVVLGTPSAAPPAWLTERYPDVLAVGPSGIRRKPGSRCEYAPASATYRRLGAAVATAMAARFGNHPSVIGWQVDNEYKSVSHDDDTRAQFQQWLARKYGSLAELNRRWCTVYWSQEFSAWTQIPLPVRTADTFPDEHYHPALQLEWKRFQGYLYRNFQAAQIDAIRAHADARQWVTHNFMGFFDLFDHYEVAADLDFVSWDSYVPLSRPDPFSNGASHDLMRGLKRRNFWLMETQPGFVNWRPANNTLDPGEVRTLAWHAIGHGADAVAYWQWRSALNSQEQYHGTILAADGTPRPIYGELAALGAELEKIAPVLEGSNPRASIGLLHSYDSRWALDIQRHNQAFDPLLQMVEWYRPLRELGHDVEIVHPSAALDAFGLIVAPSLHVVEPSMVDALRDFVARGGHLVLGPRTGVKDIDNALFPMRGPGPLGELSPARVEEFYVLDETIAIHGSMENGPMHNGPMDSGPTGSGATIRGRARIWADWLEPVSAGAEVLLRYAQPGAWVDGKAAAVTHTLGKGRVTLLGTWLDHATLLSLMRTIVGWSGVKATSPCGEPPMGVEICRRVKGTDEVWIVINHGRQPHTLRFDEPMRDLLGGAKGAALEIGALAVLVLQAQQSGQ
jgi:beta-galactosidase